MNGQGVNGEGGPGTGKVERERGKRGQERESGRVMKKEEGKGKGRKEEREKVWSVR